LTHYNLGKRYREMGRLAEARNEFETSVRLRPNFSPAFFQLGMVYRRLGEDAKARKAVQTFEDLTSREKAAKMDPIDANLEE
jgi:tetratricopeptide (TPR) repeat protein